ncbi:sensor histidine kinase [Vallitalea guaymasensis]|uniref:histidine kinase n=1 Tax=Vallitalea guaymasensis TaxID=1185412 RepID=A0A8J8MDK6_9FIRM|nr:HAMP domain-containing sensor histidine kinase [Vallitalea guaymasensis]QUH30992.1 HAMP domain-containing protein [Vallitalea guaymasensis]
MVIIIKTRKIFNSIRAKIFISYVVVSIIPLILLTNILLNSLESYYVKEKSRSMFRQANIISTNLMVRGFINDSSGIKDYVSIIGGQDFERIVILDVKSNVKFDSNGIDTGKSYAKQEVIDALGGQSSSVFQKSMNLAKVVTPIKDEKKDEVYGAIILTNSYDDINNSISSLKSISYLIILALLILILTLSYNFSGLITKPFKKLLVSINKITDGNVDEKIDIKGNNEIEEIGTAFNHMTEKLQQVDESRRQFVANVSHELKTPLSSVKVLAESLLMQPDAPKELYKEFFEDISKEIERETTIINDLLTMVTLDKNENELNISETNINLLIESILKRLKPLADIKGVEMVFESYREVIAEVDKTKISLALTNLIENGIKYNKEYGTIKVTLNSDYQNAQIFVIDTGIGIPKESINKVFQRFYRVDKTRSRETGGTGLGLSITHQAILMHQGFIRCSSELGSGTTFEVSLPLKRPIHDNI